MISAIMWFFVLLGVFFVVKSTSSHYHVYVTSTRDSVVADAALCFDVTSNSSTLLDAMLSMMDNGGQCNLRSALAACVDLTDTWRQGFMANGSSATMEGSETVACSIILAANTISFLGSELTMNASIFSSLSSSASSTARAGTASIEIRGIGSAEGNCSATVSGDSAANRFLSVTLGDMSVLPVQIRLTCLVITNFGSDSLDGGAVYLDGVTSGFIAEEVTFGPNNTASSGGALYVTSSSNVVLSSSSFYGNSASSLSGGGGGAIYIDLSTNIRIQGCDICLNEAAGFGGGINIYSNSRNCSISDSTVSYNDAGVSGGGIYLASSNEDFTLHSSTLQGNSAG
jgi:hypothetical protein